MLQTRSIYHVHLGDVQKSYHSPEGGWGHLLVWERCERRGEGSDPCVRKKILTLNICIFLLKTTKNATKPTKMWCKSGRNVNSHLWEWGGLNQSVRIVWDRGEGAAKVQNSYIFECTLTLSPLKNIKVLCIFWTPNHPLRHYVIFEWPRSVDVAGLGMMGLMVGGPFKSQSWNLQSSIK